MADQREKIIRYYRGTEGAEVAERLVDLAEQAQKSQKFRLTDFLDPFGQEIAETVAANYPGLSVDFDGGYEGAERCRALLKDTDFGGTPGFDITVICAKWNGQFVRLGHRDVLGSLMGLGVDRGKLGDILATQEEARILCDQKIAPFLLQNLTQIGAASVTCSEGDLSAIAPREERVKEIRATVASLRVDSIAAAGFGFAEPGGRRYQGGKAKAQLAERKERVADGQGRRCPLHARQRAPRSQGSARPDEERADERHARAVSLRRAGSLPSVHHQRGVSSC